jgi:multicomponent K+:H+ antiporter subunit C
MAWPLAIVIGAMVAGGVWLLLRPRSWSVILGLVIISYAVNLFIIAAGRLGRAAPPIAGTATALADPLPQALVLTAIVIGLGMTAFLTALALRGLAANGSDRLGEGPPAPEAAPDAAPTEGTPPEPRP